MDINRVHLLSLEQGNFSLKEHLKEFLDPEYRHKGGVVQTGCSRELYHICGMSAELLQISSFKGAAPTM